MLSLSALDDVVTAEELSTTVVGFCDSVQPVRHSITADNNIKTVFAFMLFTALFSLITQLLYNIRFAVSSKDIVRNENLYSKLTYTMQKYALKRYKIKQMFIFTLTKIAICYKILISVIFERIVVTMGLTLTEKILKAHLVDGEFVKGQEIGIRICLLYTSPSPRDA